MRESEIEDYLVKQVKALGGEIRKIKWIGRRGAPDRFVMTPKYHAWVELKAPGEKLQPHQQREIDRMRGLNMNVWVIDSIEEVDILIDEMRLSI